MKNIQDIAFSIDNKNIVYSFLKAAQVVNSYQNPYCSISGGRDSDIMLDIIYRVDKDKRVKYVWFDTGLEYQATKNHLVYLEDRYNIKIERIRAEKPIPAAVREYGQPFLSKFVSETIGRLQRHGFNWENENYETLILKYTKKRPPRWSLIKFYRKQIGEEMSSKENIKETLQEIKTKQAQNRKRIDKITADIKRIISECEKVDERPEVLEDVLELYIMQLERITLERVLEALISSENTVLELRATYSEEQTVLLDDIRFCAAAIKEEIETNNYYESDELAKLALRLFSNNAMHYYHELVLKII